MAKLIDIKGYWTVDSNNNSNMWEGRILLGDGNYFEGVVVNSNSVSREEELVLGIYFPDKIIVLYRIPSSVDIVPDCFDVKKDVNGYEGKYETFGLPGMSTTGVSRIVTKPVVLSNENEEFEVNELSTKIKKCFSKFNQDKLDYYYILSDPEVNKLAIESILDEYNKSKNL